MTVRDLLLTSSTRSLLAAGGALAVFAAVTLARHEPKPVGIPTIAMTTPAPTTSLEVSLEDEVEEPEAVDPTETVQSMGEIDDPADFAFVVEVGGTTYVRLAADDDLDVEPKHDRAKLVVDDFVTSAIAPVSARDLPAHLRSWKGRKVLVDGTCEAAVVGFVALARVSGDPLYADDGEGDPRQGWTIDTAFSSGRTIIAGRLDGDCIGSWARAADRPEIGRAIAVDDRKLEAATRRAFLASDHAAELTASWREAKQAGDWRDHASLDVRVVKHSITGERWAFVHAHKSGACGEYEVNVAATYQLDETGVPTEVAAGTLPGSTLEALVDLNGDGWFERVVIHEDDSDRSLTGPVDDTALAAIDVPFHGCGC
jgi:hypothetical protein